MDFFLLLRKCVDVVCILGIFFFHSERPMQVARWLQECVPVCVVMGEKCLDKRLGAQK
jgi:hypothetical protein